MPLLVEVTGLRLAMKFGKSELLSGNSGMNALRNMIKYSVICFMCTIDQTWLTKGKR
jgi:hypothetical protein